MAEFQTRAPDASGQSSGQVQEKVHEVKEQASDQAQKLAGKAKQQVSGRVDEKSTQFGEQLGSGADTIRSVASELRNNDQAQPAQYAEQAADKVHELADYLKRSDGPTIMRDLEDFGRKQPWVVVLGGLTLGFVASRFLKASSTSRYQSSQEFGRPSIAGNEALTSGAGDLETTGPNTTSDGITVATADETVDLPSAPGGSTGSSTSGS
jgi:hypothetical protein